jgi:hypothetical protein
MRTKAAKMPPIGAWWMRAPRSEKEDRLLCGAVNLMLRLKDYAQLGMLPASHMRMVVGLIEQFNKFEVTRPDRPLPTALAIAAWQYVKGVHNERETLEMATNLYASVGDGQSLPEGASTRALRKAANRTGKKTGPKATPESNAMRVYLVLAGEDAHANRSTSRSPLARLISATKQSA